MVLTSAVHSASLQGRAAPHTVHHDATQTAAASGAVIPLHWPQGPVRGQNQPGLPQTFPGHGWRGACRWGCSCVFQPVPGRGRVPQLQERGVLLEPPVQSPGLRHCQQDWHPHHAGLQGPAQVCVARPDPGGGPDALFHLLLPPRLLHHAHHLRKLHGAPEQRHHTEADPPPPGPGADEGGRDLGADGQAERLEVCGLHPQLVHGLHQGQPHPVCG